MPSIPLPGSTFTFSIPLVSADSHLFKAAATIAAGDFQRSINNGAFANMENTPTVTPTGGKLVQIVVSAAETTAAGEGGTIDIIGSDAAGAEWDDISINLRVGVIAANAAQISGDAVAADNAEAFFDGTGYAGTNNVIPTVTTLTNMPSAAPSAATIAAEILVTPANKLATGAAGVVTPSGGTINSVSSTISANLVQIEGETVPVDNLVLALGTGGLVEKLNSMLEAAGLDYRFTAEALAEAPSSGSGSGSTAYTNTVTDDSSNPLDGVEVWITSDSGGASTVASTTTSTLGTFTVYLDPGTYYLWLAKGGYNFPNPTTITVS